MYESLRVGDRLTIEAPLGTFVPREDSERPMLLVAGGTGFAPVKAIVEHFIALGTRRPMFVYWGARTVADLYLIDLARRWTEELSTITFIPVLSDPQAARMSGLREGLIHEAVLEDHPDLADFDLYMSGPPPMIAAGRQRFVEANLAGGPALLRFVRRGARRAGCDLARPGRHPRALTISCPSPRAAARSARRRCHRRARTPC